MLKKQKKKNNSVTCIVLTVKLILKSFGNVENIKFLKFSQF